MDSSGSAGSAAAFAAPGALGEDERGGGFFAFGAGSPGRRRASAYAFPALRLDYARPGALSESERGDGGGAELDRRLHAVVAANAPFFFDGSARRRRSGDSGGDASFRRSPAASPPAARTSRQPASPWSRHSPPAANSPGGRFSSRRSCDPLPSPREALAANRFSSLTRYRRVPAARQRSPAAERGGHAGDSFPAGSSEEGNFYTQNYVSPGGRREEPGRPGHGRYYEFSGRGGGALRQAAGPSGRPGRGSADFAPGGGASARLPAAYAPSGPPLRGRSGRLSVDSADRSGAASVEIPFLDRGGVRNPLSSSERGDRRASYYVSPDPSWGEDRGGAAAAGIDIERGRSGSSQRWLARADSPGTPRLGEAPPHALARRPSLRAAAAAPAAPAAAPAAAVSAASPSASGGTPRLATKHALVNSRTIKFKLGLDLIPWNDIEEEQKLVKKKSLHAAAAEAGATTVALDLRCQETARLEAETRRLARYLFPALALSTLLWVAAAGLVVASDALWWVAPLPLAHCILAAVAFFGFWTRSEAVLQAQPYCLLVAVYSSATVVLGGAASATGAPRAIAGLSALALGTLGFAAATLLSSAAAARISLRNQHVFLKDLLEHPQALKTFALPPAVLARSAGSAAAGSAAAFLPSPESPAAGGAGTPETPETSETPEAPSRRFSRARRVRQKHASGSGRRRRPSPPLSPAATSESSPRRSRWKSERRARRSLAPAFGGLGKDFGST